MTSLAGLEVAHGESVIRAGNEAMSRESLRPFLDTITADELRDLTAVIAGVNDAHTVGVVFLVGRDHLRTGELRDGAPAKRSRSSLVAWAKSESQAMSPGP